MRFHGDIVDYKFYIKRTSQTFFYTYSTKDLWDEILERYGETSEPLIYQIQRKINAMQQSNDSVFVYFT